MIAALYLLYQATFYLRGHSPAPLSLLENEKVRLDSLTHRWDSKKLNREGNMGSLTAIARRD
jgi:hypothetical protein